MIYIILLIIILFLLFSDIIVKILKGKKKDFYKSKKIKSQEYEIDSKGEMSLTIDVIDSDIKILCDDTIKNITIQLKYLLEEYCCDVSYDDKNISIIKNNVNHSKQIGNMGRILIKVPKKDSIGNLDILVNNGDIELYDLNLSNLDIKSSGGIIKLDSFKSKYISLFKESGDVYIHSLESNELRLNVKNGNSNLEDVYGESMDVFVLSGDFIFANSNKDYEIPKLNVRVDNGRKVLDVNYKEKND